MKFSVGDIVKFKKVINNIYHVFDYKAEWDGIPDELIIHGTTVLDKEYYKKNFATIKAIHNEYYIVNFFGDNGWYVQLGFEEKSLELVKRKSFKAEVMRRLAVD